MSTPRNWTRRGRVAVVAGVIGLASVTAVAFADVILVDGDVVAIGDNSTVQLADATRADATATAKASFQLQCQGPQNHVDRGKVVTLAFDAGQSSAGLSAGNTTITAPSTWPLDGTPCPSPGQPLAADSGDVTVEVDVPSDLGAHSFTSKWNANLNYTDSPAITGSGPSVNYNLNVNPRPGSLLVATANGQNQVDLSWTGSPDAGDITDYVVYRDGTALSTHPAKTATSFSDTGRSPSTQYCYTIKARYNDGTTDFFSSASNQSCATTASANTPPTVSVTGVTDGASYEYGTVPAAGCKAEDAQDGTSTFAATLSAITGPHAADGIGSQTADCSYTDEGGLSRSASATYSIVDTTAPVLTVPSADVVREATSAAGATVNFGSLVSATDAVDATPTINCVPASGSVFGLGVTEVSCTASDYSDNTSPAKTFNVKVQDTTAPSLTVPSADVVEEATSAAGATVNFASQVSATDAVDATPSIDCVPASGSVFGLGVTEVSCTASDDSGNTSPVKKFNVKVQDTTAPTLGTLPANINAAATSSSGAVVTYQAPGATDAVDPNPVVQCTPASGSTFSPGSTTVSCTAKDASNNVSAAGTFTVTVTFNWLGFFQPVDNKILNGMKAGSTAPIKWQVPDGNGGYISSTSIVSSIGTGVVSCSPSVIVDTLEEYATGGTSLRYDTTGNQFIYNWQSPKKPGTCYGVRIKLTDNTVHEALFNLR